MISRSQQLFRKSEAALIASIEVYNKPDFAYREETFSVLALNAWELLLKAKVVADNGNDVRSIYVYESRRSKAGAQTARKYVRRNRVGNPHTLGLSQLINKLDQNAATRLSPTVKANLQALTEVRDNAVHYMNASPQLAKQVLELGTAAVKNYIEAARRWFSQDLSRLSLYLMPIGFVAPPGTASAVVVGDEANLVKFLADLVATTDPDPSSSFHVALEVNLSFKRSATAPVAVALTTDPSAPKVHLSEEDIRKAYPWSYDDLVENLRKRYSDFKLTSKFHQIRQALLTDKRLVHTRLLDPGNPKSPKKPFHNSNIVNEFDKHYTRR